MYSFQGDKMYKYRTERAKKWGRKNVTEFNNLYKLLVED